MTKQDAIDALVALTIEKQGHAEAALAHAILVLTGNLPKDFPKGGSQ